MSVQLTFDLPLRPAMGREDFFVSSPNATALALIDSWRDWSTGKLVLTGDAGAGKTHLAHVWVAQSGGRIVAAPDIAAVDLGDLPSALAVEDCGVIAGDAALEEALFHLHNALFLARVPLLITARSAPSRWGIGLPDLASRLGQAGLAHLAPPDDALLIAVMVKRAMDRQLQITPKMLSYLAPRLPRSFAAADAVIARIDAHALREKRQPNQTHMRAALAEVMGEASS